MSGEVFSFRSVILGYFADDGFRVIDHYSQDQFVDEDIASRLIKKTTGGVVGFAIPSVRDQLSNHLYGPEPFTDNPQFSMYYYLWAIKDRFTSDPRHQKKGILTGLFLVCDRCDEKIIESHNARDIVKSTLKEIVSKLLDIDSLIHSSLQINPNTEVTQSQYDQLIDNGGNGKLTGTVCLNISQRVSHNWKQYNTLISLEEKFEKIFHYMILRKGTQNEIKGEIKQRVYFMTILEKFTQLLIQKMSDLQNAINNNNISDGLITQIYNVIMDSNLWKNLPVEKIPDPRIINKDVNHYFFYNWLIHKIERKDDRIKAIYKHLTSFNLIS